MSDQNNQDNRDNTQLPIWATADLDTLLGEPPYGAYTSTPTMDDVDAGWGDDEVTTEYLPNFELLSARGAAEVAELVADDFDPAQWKWESSELRRCYFYDVVRLRGDNRGAFFVQGDTIVGYQLCDNAGWKKLEGRKL